MLPLRKEIIFEILLALVILVFIVASFYYSPRARLVPLVVGFFSLGLVFWQIVADGAARKPGRGTEETLSTVKHAVAFAVACGFLVVLFGYFGCAGITTLALTRYWFKETWFASISITASLLLFSYFLFTMMFAIELYPGLIPSFVISLLPE